MSTKDLIGSLLIEAEEEVAEAVARAEAAEARAVAAEKKAATETSLRARAEDAREKTEQRLREVEAANGRAETALSQERARHEDPTPLKTRIATLEAQLEAEKNALEKEKQHALDMAKAHSAALAAIPKIPPAAPKPKPPSAFEFVVTQRDANGDIRNGVLKPKT